MEEQCTINDIVEKIGIEKADGLSFAAILRIRGREIEAKGTIKIIGGCIQFLVLNGFNIRKRERYNSYGAGTRVVQLL